MTDNSGGKLERAANVVKSFSLTNILILALIIVIAVPAYFAYLFMTDVAFRREFMTSAVILDQHAPCFVLEGHRHGSVKRHSVIIAYGNDGRLEKLIGLRAPSAMDPDTLDETCKKVEAMADAVRDKK